jgi:hypothetical protein
MCSAQDNVALPTLGFPIRASAGHWQFSASPRLIAAVHALLRLLVPRHPPCALTILTVIYLGRVLRLLPGDTRVIGYCAVFKVREEASPPDQSPGRSPSSRRRRAGLSKLNSMRAAWRRARESAALRPARSGRHASGRSRSRRAPRTPKSSDGDPAAIGALQRRAP